MKNMYEIELYNDGDCNISIFDGMANKPTSKPYHYTWLTTKQNSKSLLIEILELLQGTRLEVLNYCFKDIDLHKKLPTGKFSNGNYNIEIKKD